MMDLTHILFWLSLTGDPAMGTIGGPEDPLVLRVVVIGNNLDHDDFDKRDEAQAELEKMGRPAVQFIEKNRNLFPTTAEFDFRFRTVKLGLIDRYMKSLEPLPAIDGLHYDGVSYASMNCLNDQYLEGKIQPFLRLARQGRWWDDEGEYIPSTDGYAFPLYRHATRMFVEHLLDSGWSEDSIRFLIWEMARRDDQFMSKHYRGMVKTVTDKESTWWRNQIPEVAAVSPDDDVVFCTFPFLRGYYAMIGKKVLPHKGWRGSP